MVTKTKEAAKRLQTKGENDVVDMVVARSASNGEVLKQARLTVSKGGHAVFLPNTRMGSFKAQLLETMANTLDHLEASGEQALEKVGEEFADLLARFDEKAHEKYVSEFTSIVARLRDSDDSLNQLFGGQQHVHALKQRKYIKEYPLLSPMQILEVMGRDRVSNPSKTMSDMVKRKELFSAQEGRQHKYPAFQIDLDSAAPYPVLKDLLTLLEHLSDWGLYYWFCEPRGSLGMSPANALAEPGLHDELLGLASATRDAARGE